MLPELAWNLSHGIERGMAVLTCKENPPTIIPEGREASVLKECGSGRLFRSTDARRTATLLVIDMAVVEDASLVVGGRPWLILA